MLVFEIIFLPYLGRLIVQGAARPHTAAAVYSVFFLVAGLVFGSPFLPALVGRLFCFGLVFLYLFLLARFSGLFLWVIVVALGVTIPFLVGSIIEWVALRLSPQAA